MIAFIVEHDRLPSAEESAHLGLGFVSTAGADAVPRTLRFLRRLVSFYDGHGRMPDAEELDDSNQ